MALSDLFNNIVISLLYRTCWNNLATSLIISLSTRLLQLLTSCSKQDVRFLRVFEQVCQQAVNKVVNTRQALNKMLVMLL
jgi:hypothetical protein